jgi:hypothetical protein
MRTTISISDHLLKEAKKVSVERRCSLGEVIDEALTVTLLARPGSLSRHKPKPFVTFSGIGTLPGVDLNSNASLLDLMESP